MIGVLQDPGLGAKSLGRRCHLRSVLVEGEFINERSFMLGLLLHMKRHTKRSTRDHKRLDIFPVQHADLMI